MSNKKILITGGSGLLGEEVCKLLPSATHFSSKILNLLDYDSVSCMVRNVKPDIIIHLAARVGGILDNINRPFDYYIDNSVMNNNILGAAVAHECPKFLAMLSTCIYPDNCSQYPIKEEMLHLGPPAKTNFSYGYAKRSLAVAIDACNQQYETKYNYLIPCNLYGINDKFEEEKSHFIASLIKKIYDANTNKTESIKMLGDGSPLRQFMHARDLATIIKEVVEKDITDNFNVATEDNLSIAEMVRIALKATNSTHLKVEYDRNSPNGQLRKDVSIAKFRTYFPNYEFITLSDGVKEVYDEFSRRHDRQI